MLHTQRERESVLHKKLQGAFSPKLDVVTKCFRQNL